MRTNRLSSPSLRGRMAGITFLELMIYIALIAILGSPIVYTAQVSLRSTQEHDVITRVAERNRMALHRVVRELRPCIGDTVILTGANSLTFTLPNTYDGTAIVPGDTVRYTFQIASDETLNGADDNGNGLIDEAQLRRTNLTTGESFSLCEGLDLAASGFSQVGSAITVTVVNAGQLTGDATTYSVSRSLTITPRN